MKVICLCGKAKSGKTLTIKMIFSEIREKGKILYPDNLKKNEGDDFVAVVQVGVRRIGFISAGDSERNVKTGYEKIRPFNCDVVVRAARSKGITRRPDEEKDADVLLIKKPYLDIEESKRNTFYESCCNAINEHTARYVITEIMENN